MSDKTLLTVEDRLDHAHDRLAVAVTVLHPHDTPTLELVFSAIADSVRDLEAVSAALEAAAWGRAALSTPAPSIEGGAQ